MKVEGPRPATGPKDTAKTKKTADGSFGALVHEGDAAAEATAARAATPAAPLDALIALQADEHSSRKEVRERAQERGEDLLQHLDTLRMGLLSGGLPESTLRELSHIIAQKKDGTLDPRLSEILDEIDLRARVELAKLGRD